MSSSSSNLKTLLLERLVRGEISQEEYDRMVGLIDEHQPVDAVTDPSDPYVSVTGLPTDPGGASSIVGQLQPLTADDRLGKYTLVEKIGVGGMGIVWKARHPIGEGDVVIKVLPPELSRDAVHLEKFRASFEIVRRLNHQFICPIYDLEHDPRVGYYLVMKFLEAETFDVYRRRLINEAGRLRFNRLLKLLEQVAIALDAAHRQKIVHRDIKSSNIMVSPSGEQVWVIDFGLAAEMRSTMALLSKERMESSGTYPYMAPEQWKGQRQTAATDQYALAILTYEMLTGRLPFEGDATVLCRCALEESLPTIPKVPDSVNDALTRATSKEPDARFQTCREFVRALVTENQKRPKSNHSKEPTDPEEQYQLGLKYYEGVEVPQDYEKAVYWFQKAAAESHGLAEYHLGMCCWNGRGAPEEKGKAIILFQKAGDRNVPEAQFELGMAYLHGHFVKRDVDLGVRLIRKAAESGLTNAQFKLGTCYSSGDGIPKNVEKAATWFERSAELGHSDAQNNLGVCYYHGRGVAKDHQKAVYWYQKSAEQDNPKGMNNLAICFARGEGVQQDWEESVKWYHDAASKGLPNAQYSLAWRYYVGQGVIRDLDKAEYWFMKAKENGHPCEFEIRSFLFFQKVFRGFVKR